MSEDISPNKISAKQERHAEKLKEKFEDQGMGQDHAAKRALEEVSKEQNTGGGNSAGDAKNGASYEGNHRRGSAKDAG